MTIKTMLAAAAVTIGMLAHGALPSGTSFETLSAGATVDKAALEAADEGATWTLPADQTVTAWGDEIKPASRSDEFEGVTQKNYLGIKTTLGEYVSRNVGQQTIGDGGLYVDTLVKFTAADEDIAVPSDAKIGVWVKTNEDETENRLMISAGPLNDGAATVYDCGTLSDADAWKRLTVKALYNIDGNGALGFVVYVDDEARDSAAAKTAFAGKTLTPNAAKFAINGNLFPSIVDSNKLSEIAVSGQGGIDDVVITATAPDFAKDYEFISLKFDTAKIAKLYVTDAEGNLQEFTSSPANYEIMGETAKSYYYDAQPGYISVGSDKAIEIEGTEVEITDVAAAAFKIGETAYASWADAVDALSGEATITLVADYTMTEDDLEASIDNTAATTLDLNGKTLTGCVNFASALAVTDSTETKLGKMVPAEADGAVIQEPVDAEGELPDLLIQAGTFDGGIYATEITIVGIGAKFYDTTPAEDPEADFPLCENPWTVEGVGNFEAVWAANYWTVQEAAAPTTAEVTISAENVTVTVMAGETPVVSGGTVEVGTVLTITATPATDYQLATLTVKGAEFTSGSTYTVVEGDAGNTIAIAATATAIPYVAQIGEKKFLTLAAAAADESAAGATIKLLADVDGFATLSTAASTLDLNGKKIGAYAGELKITFTGDDAKTVKGGEFGNYNNKITFTVSQNLTITDMIFHQQVDTVGAGELVVTDSTFKNDLNTTGTEDVSTAEADYTYYSFNLAVGTGFAKSTITGNTFYQARRCCLQLTNLTGPAYVYNNTFDGTKQCLTKSELAQGRKFGAAQIFGQKAPIYIENNSYSGEWIAETFTMYNEARSKPTNPDNYITDQPVVFNGNTVAATVPYLWFNYLSPDNGGVTVTNMPNIVWGDLSGVAASVDRTKGQYKALVQANPEEVAVEANLAVPAGVTYCYQFAGDYYVNDAVVAFDALKVGDTVIVLPGAALESETLVFTPVTGYKNKYTVEAPAPKGIEPGQSIGLGNPGTMTLEQAQAEAAKLPIVLTAEDKAAGLTTESLCVKAVMVGGAFQAVVDVKPELAPAVDATAETPIEVGAENFSATVKNPVKGLYYYFTASATVDGTYAPAGDAVRAGDAGVTLTAPKGGAASFYKLNAAVRPPVK